MMKKQDKPVLKCRGCKNEIEFAKSITFCPRCGAAQLYPANAGREQLEYFSKAAEYMAEGEFYHALRFYEIILKATPGSGQARFGRLCANYGVAREKDGDKDSYILVCRRLQPGSVFEDEDYRAAIGGALPEERRVYEEEARQIEEEQGRLREIENRRHEENKALYGDTDEATGLSFEYLEAKTRAEERRERERTEKERARREEEEREERRRLEKEARLAKEKKKQKTARAVFILIPCLILAAVSVWISFNFIKPAIIYNGAKADIESGNYAGAARALRALGGYKDSGALLRKYQLHGLEAGDTVSLGKCEQDGNAGNGPEDIEWITLTVQNGRALLLSKYIIDAKKYNETHTSITWEDCTLRAYLNDDFYHGVFNLAEMDIILESENKNPDNIAQSTKGGADTLDRVFVLSIEEAEKYVAGKDFAGAAPTPNVAYYGVYEDKDGGTRNSYWWLRSPGGAQSNAAKIEFNGSISYKGAMVHYSKYGVRPAIWIEIPD